MPVAATGMFSLPVENARLLLAQSATWQSLTGAADEDEAYDFIYLDRAPDSAEYPIALVILSDDYAARAYAAGSPYLFATSGTISIHFEMVIPEEYQGVANWNDASMDMRNKMGAICQECLDLANVDGNLFIESASMPEGPILVEISQRAIGSTELPVNGIGATLLWTTGGGLG